MLPMFPVSGGDIVMRHRRTAAFLPTGLERPSVAEGSYWAPQAGAAVGSGRDKNFMENVHGVDSTLAAHSHGAHLGASIMRFSIRILR
ncbi:hypothetical protein CFR80_13810 [Komagataeibacter oboediens]|uniref:Uncharacterized protein n=1 Tax=Komagataeibacter oboediens TaxID=65958 RepID=A0A318QPI5_9PROT|nr:hypothetical protein GLUCORHAEAF1_10200 [Komagataeibacter rhaeticus AF1]PYD80340.1 hypothetical protein CFR80_13810 [Komagataeibacter oboediens]